MTIDSLAGVVLAGGYSERFGDRDKALATLGGTPMVRRVVDRLAGVTDEVVVACRDEQVASIRKALDGADPRIRFATDPIPDRGPLVGIRGGLEATDREYGAVVACDMPFVDPTLFELLYQRIDDRDAAVVQLADGWYQPIGGVYRANPTIDACRRLLDGGVGRTVALLDELEWVRVREADLRDFDPAVFTSVDTRTALREAERRIARREGEVDGA